MTLNMFKLNDTTTEVMVIKPARDRTVLDLGEIQRVDAAIQSSKQAQI